jgi:hypothetical protein
VHLLWGHSQSSTRLCVFCTCYILLWHGGGINLLLALALISCMTLTPSFSPQQKTYLTSSIPTEIPRDPWWCHHLLPACLWDQMFQSVYSRHTWLLLHLSPRLSSFRPQGLYTCSMHADLLLSFRLTETTPHYSTLIIHSRYNHTSKLQYFTPYHISCLITIAEFPAPRRMPGAKAILPKRVLSECALWQRQHTRSSQHFLCMGL